MNLRIFHLFRKRNLSPRLKQEWGYDILSPNTEQVLKDFKSAKGGLTEKEAARRLKLYGFNEPAEKQKRKLFYEIIMEFANPLIVLLLVIGTFSVLFGEKFSAIIIYVMAAMSGLLSFFQEHRAEKAVEKLNALVRVTTAVIRNGKEEEKSVKILVPGDIISLSAGDTIPADLRIIEANGLFVNQSALTGESMPIEKYAQSLSLEKPSQIFQSDILAFMGSSVASGTGLGIAVHTGRYTEFGKLSENLGQVRPETAFDKGIKNFTWMMIKAILIMVVLIVLINTLGRLSFFESLLFALAVAVGLAPETLPMIVTINLSKGALLMSKKKVVVKRLDAIQNFGAMDILCTDKT
ncbi:MAG: HAD-IC family P-type ATPase, partial [Candidatus Doudnabacteria bacterium]|nr:HAD-IC family P-type ATPase [Candidatus Doudnabacteria bacterium]